MTESIWPVTINAKKYEEPQQINDKWIINGESLINVLEDEPELWNHLVKHKSNLKPNIVHFMDNISYPFIQSIPNQSFVRILLPDTEWQEELEHQYAIVEFIHCAKYITVA